MPTINPKKVVASLSDAQLQAAVADEMHWRKSGMLPDRSALRDLVERLVAETSLWISQDAERDTSDLVLLEAARRWAGLSPANASTQGAFVSQAQIVAVASLVAAAERVSAQSLSAAVDASGMLDRLAVCAREARAVLDPLIRGEMPNTQRVRVVLSQGAGFETVYEKEFSTDSEKQPRRAVASVIQDVARLMRVLPLDAAPAWLVRADSALVRAEVSWRAADFDAVCQEALHAIAVLDPGPGPVWRDCRALYVRYFGSADTSSQQPRDEADDSSAPGMA